MDLNNQMPEASYSEQIINKIIAFDEKMNSGLKSGETTTLDSAIWNKEASLNYNYAHPELSVKNYIVEKSFYTVNIDENNNVLLEDVSSTYTAMEETLNNEYEQIPNSDKGIILSDVKMDSIVAGTAFLSLTNIFGFNLSALYEPFEEDDDWIWGSLFDEPEGKCDGTMVGVSDGSDELQYRLNHRKMETVYKYGFTDIEIVLVDYQNCQYFEPVNTKRVFNSINQTYCMQNDELTDYLIEYDYIIYTDNDTLNDYGFIIIEDNEGAKPEEKVFISIQIFDDYFMYTPIRYFHFLKISYGIPYDIAPIE